MLESILVFAVATLISYKMFEAYEAWWEARQSKIELETKLLGKIAEIFEQE